MVYFQCEYCNETLKKKQVENHYTHQCRQANAFRCLTCQQVFDRTTIKAHTSCITEAEKYQKGDNMVKQKVINIKPKPIIPVDISELKWSGFKKTTSIILKSKKDYKWDINNILKTLAIVYANQYKEIPENVDMALLKKYFFNKIEKCNKFSINLDKGNITFKN